MEVDNGALEDDFATCEQRVFHFHVSEWECTLNSMKTQVNQPNVCNNGSCMFESGLD